MLFVALFDVGAALLAIFLTARIVQRRRSASTPHLPPGPKGWPVLGNLLDLPASHEWKTFGEWSDSWGDIMSIQLLNQPIVILSSSTRAMEMLEKKSAIYSNRSTMTVAGEMIGWDRTLGFHQYGSHWREIRRLHAQFMGTRETIAKISDVLERQAHRYLLRLMRDPHTLQSQIHRLTAAIVLELVYGYQVQDGTDPLVEIVDRAVNELSLASAPGAFLADTLPFLRHVPDWMPGTRWKKTVQAWATDYDIMSRTPYEFAKGKIAAGIAPSSFVSKLLQDDASPERESVIQDAATSFYAAGADTTASAICTFYLAMMCYPEVQRKAQEEIDTVIGGERLPELADRERLPYVNAVCLEVLRWQPVTPLGMPHRLIQDDMHAGYHLPRGTIIYTNVWKMLHDPETYSDPDLFIPERFIASQWKKVEMDPRQIAFGFGRRICPGRYLAEATLFLACSMSLAAFNIAKPVVDGHVVEPAIEYSTGSISHPNPFQCSIKARSDRAASLIISTGVNDQRFKAL